MKFTAGTPAEALKQTLPQPGTRWDAHSGVGQRFGNWWDWPPPTRGQLGVVVPLWDRERSPARLKILSILHCAGSRVGSAPSAKPIPLIAALGTSSDQDFVWQDREVRRRFHLLTWAWEGRS